MLPLAAIRGSIMDTLIAADDHPGARARAGRRHPARPSRRRAPRGRAEGRVRVPVGSRRARSAATSSIDFIAVSSYGSSATSSGQVQLLKDLDTSIEGRDVVIVEDIVDTGLTLTYLQDILRARAPRRLRTACLLSKPSRRKVPVVGRLRGVRHRGPVRGRLRAGPRRALPRAALYRRRRVTSELCLVSSQFGQRFARARRGP